MLFIIKCFHYFNIRYCYIKWHGVSPHTFCQCKLSAINDSWFIFWSQKLLRDYAPHCHKPELNDPLNYTYRYSKYKDVQKFLHQGPSSLISFYIACTCVYVFLNSFIEIRSSKHIHIKWLVLTKQYGVFS